jgi:3-deoxy-D-manno-octulosonic acid kinase
MQTSEYRNDNSFVLVNQNVLTGDNSECIFGDHADNACPSVSDDQGRGKVIFFKFMQLELVLKRYHRGGLLGRMIKNTYLFTGLNRTRMWQEFRLLGLMRDKGLPVPRPVAARCTRSSTFGYQGDLIIERIPGARTLAEILQEESLPEHVWRNVGLVIRRFHDNRIDHTDLNACNIMLNSSGQMYLIDFDKCRERRESNRANSNVWQKNNLARLNRSLHKWLAKDGNFHFSPGHWELLLNGYQSSRSTTDDTIKSQGKESRLAS